MAAPTLAASAQSVWNTNGATKTVSVTVQTGDQIVVGCGTEDTGTTFNTPTNDGTALTWTLKQEAAGASNARAAQWTAVADSNRTIIITGNRAGVNNDWGMYANAWRGSNGIGASNKVEGDTSANFSVGITTTQDNSALDVLIVDWGAVGGARTYLTTGVGAFTEQNNIDDGAQYATQHGYHADVGTAGAKTVGDSAPAGQDVSIVVVEVLGTGAGNVTVNMGSTQAVLTLSAQAPSPKAKVFPVLASMSLTANAPQPKTQVSSVAASLSLAALAPVNVRARVSPPSAILSLVAQAPTIRLRVATVAAGMQLTANTPALRAIASALTPILRFQTAPPIQASDGTAPPQTMGKQSGLVDEQTADVYHHGRRA